MLSSIILIVRLVGELGVSGPTEIYQDVCLVGLSPCQGHKTRRNPCSGQRITPGCDSVVYTTKFAFREKRRRFLYREQGLNVAARLNGCMRALT